ncbi:MAG: SpoIIIAC/SpoIIIAD family protein [[Ruminococcus] gnavus]|nr:SpoIIIAC/SpoIIIAD family protein [Mediterraneibacter gnavus]
MSVLQISLIGIVGVLLAVQLKNGRSEYGFLMSMAAGIFLFFCIAEKLELFLRAVEEIRSFLTIDTEYLAIMMKMIGITYIAQFSSGICKDAGYQTIAAQIEIFSKLSILAVGMPVLLALLETIQEFFR